VSFASSNPLVATVSGTTLRAVAAGTATITAIQGGNANYLAAPSVSYELTVNPAAGSGSNGGGDVDSGDGTPIPQWAFIGCVAVIVAGGLRYLLPERGKRRECQ
jgi:hypothetical protein